MKKFIYIMSLGILFYSCAKNLPEFYGVYSYDGHNYMALKSQKTFFEGNLLVSISGLKSSSGVVFKNVESLIVFLQNAQPNQIKLARLYLQKGGYVQNPVGQSYVNINLWTVQKEIPVDIAPIENKKDMYKVTPSEPLDSGFYAIHFGSLTNKETYSAFDKVAYDFVIGSSTESYRSVEEINLKNDQEFSANAERLLLQINDLFNKQDHSSIRKLYYNADGNEFNDSEWNSIVEGFRNWYSQSGRIKSSQIIGKNVYEDIGSFTLQTEYEKSGTINEELRVLKKGSSYYITFIGTN